MINKAIHTYCPDVLRTTLERIESSEIGYRLVKGTFWSIAGAVISRGLMLIASISVARILGKTGFGEFGMIQSTVGMFGVFAGFGLGMTATKHVAEYRKDDPERAGRIIVLSEIVAISTGGLMAIGLYFFAPWLAEHTINAPHLAGVLRIGALILFISALNGAQTGALSGFEAFKTIAIDNFFTGLLSFPIFIGGAWFGGLIGAVWALVINLCFNWLLNHLALRKEARRYKIPLVFDGIKSEVPILWKFSLPSVLSGATVGPAIWACNALLVNQPGGYGEMGVYNAVMRVKQVPEMILVMLMPPLLPMLTEYFSRGNTRSYNNMLSYAFTVSLFVVIPITFVQAAVPMLTLLPYGREYQGNIGVVQWLMAHNILVGLCNPFGNILASMNRMWFGFVYNLSWGIGFVVLSYLLVPTFRATGMAAAWSIVYLVTSFLCVTYVYRYEKIFIHEIPLGYLSLSVSLMFGACIVSSILFQPIMAGIVSGFVVIIFVVTIIRLMRKKQV